MKINVFIIRLVLFLAFALTPLEAALAQNIQQQFNDVGQKFIQGMNDAKAAREAREQQEQQQNAILEQQRQDRQDALEQQRQEEADALARRVAQDKAEADRLAAERAAQKLAADRSTLDQNLGGIGLQLGSGASPNLSTAASPPPATPAPSPSHTENLSNDPLLAAHLRQVGELVRAGKFAEARKLAGSCATLYPDDPRAKTALEQIAVLDPAPATGN
jgi:hypothetical protein